MTPARMERIWRARDGLCGNCSKPVPMRGPGVRYDHFIPIWIVQADDDENVWPLHTKTCDAPKLAVDLGVIAKIKRLIKKADPETRNPSKMHSRGFGKQRRPLGSKTQKRLFSGRVVKRI